MRSGALVLGAALMWAAPAAAQDGHFGVKGGVNVATQQTTDSSGSADLTSRVGLVAGGFVRLPLFSSLDVQIEGLYSVKGAKLSFGGVDGTLALDYLEIPVVARLRLGSGHTRPYVSGGVVPAVRLRARSQTAFSGSTESIDVSSEVETTDLGIAAGGGVDIGSLVIDARYTFGVRDIDKADASRTKNRALAITAGLRF